MLGIRPGNFNSECIVGCWHETKKGTGVARKLYPGERPANWKMPGTPGSADEKKHPSTADVPGPKLHPGQRPPDWVGPDGSVPASANPNTRILIIIGAVVWAAIVGAAIVSNSLTLSSSEGAKSPVTAKKEREQVVATATPVPSAKRQAVTTSEQDGDDDMASTYADASRQSLWIVKSRDAIRAKLRDPDSAEFQNVHFYSGSGKPIVCGEVNAKNGFGGYSGFEPFVAAGTTLAVLSSEVSSAAEMAKIVKELCVRSPTDVE